MAIVRVRVRVSDRVRCFGVTLSGRVRVHVRVDARVRVRVGQGWVGVRKCN